jgi:hypothetical protein
VSDRAVLPFIPLRAQCALCPGQHSLPRCGRSVLILGIGWMARQVGVWLAGQRRSAHTASPRREAVQIFEGDQGIATGGFCGDDGSKRLLTGRSTVGEGIGSAILILIGLIGFGLPMRCQGLISKPPYRGCRKRVYGLVGNCRFHGRRAGLRLIAVFGGIDLPQRRVCERCGSPSMFCRASDTGKPFLGCSAFPNCKNPRWLSDYTF